MGEPHLTNWCLLLRAWFLLPFFKKREVLREEDNEGEGRLDTS